MTAPAAPGRGFDPRRLLMALRDGTPADAGDIRAFALGLADGQISDSQAGAFAMAVCQRGLGEAGRVALTEAMRDSGDVLDWDLPGPVVDKHSTGGIGDSISLLLAPALAACGCHVPMISGRGLGHTGGTLDKLEAIPGYRTTVEVPELRRISREIGCAIVGASTRIAPADRRLYAVRDVTGTVESIDLITASILSKKLAAGLGALVLDVKVGSGAFMASLPEARALARALVSTATGAGCPARALISDMDQPLANTAGNALEVAEVIDTLTGRQISPALWDLTVALGGEILVLAGVAPDVTRGGAAVAEALSRGLAAERFAAMVAALGGPSDLLDHPGRSLPAAPVIRDIEASAPGVVTGIDTRAVGMAVVGLGGGRRRESDLIDPSVGFSQLAHIGDPVGPGRPIGRVHAKDDEAAIRAGLALQAAYRIGEDADPPALIHERIA